MRISIEGMGGSKQSRQMRECVGEHVRQDRPHLVDHEDRVQFSVHPKLVVEAILPDFVQQLPVSHCAGGGVGVSRSPRSAHRKNTRRCV